MKKHLLQCLEKVLGMERKMAAVELENTALRVELSECRSSLTNLEAETVKLKEESKKKDVDIASLKSIVDHLQKERDERDLALVKGGDFGDMVERDGPNTGFDNLYKMPTSFPSKVSHRDFVKMPMTRDAHFKPLGLDQEHDVPVFSVTGEVPGAGPVNLEQVKQEVEVVQSKLRRLSDIVQSTQDNQTRHGVFIDEIRLRQDVLDVKTTSGIQIWKIPDIRRRFRDAMDRRTISLYSPPFYTSPHGYRMCIRAYLNGDGIGKGTHISLFFVVMRSEHDNLLPWPFKQSVRFTLINQKNPPASITEAFVPDLSSPSFHKPETDMNIASGFPKFARQSVLNDENFTQGNMIFIKCQVDLTGLPTH